MRSALLPVVPRSALIFLSFTINPRYILEKEVEEIFFNRPKYRFVESGYREGEDVYSAAGQTDAGRYLIVFFIQKEKNLALILSARDMDQKERRRYEKK
ncbi:MAG: BrnT family toxin [Candidatus Poribacteria bacterium]|nr:BrnT family toxin [Candidatus Poribacteria bacterium]